MAAALYTNNRNTWTCRHVLNSDLHTNTYSYIHTHQSKQLSHIAHDCGNNISENERMKYRKNSAQRNKRIRNKSNNNTNTALPTKATRQKKDRSHAMLLYIINYQDTCFHATYLAHIRFPRKNSQSQRFTPLSIHLKLFSENVFNPLAWIKCNGGHLFGMVMSVAIF